MRKDFGAKPYTYPQPVLMIATYGEDGKPDVMNAAWGGISDDKEISICVSESHKTTENILKKGAFTTSDYSEISCLYVNIRYDNIIHILFFVKNIQKGGAAMRPMREKMHTGELYLPNDDEIFQDQIRKLDRLYDFNMTRPT